MTTMNNKVCLVTGATAGIGKWTAAALAQMGAKVVIVSRSRERGEAARSEILSTTQNGSIEILLADLSSQRSVRELASQYLAQYERLDVLVNNAGAVHSSFVETVDGIEATFATNHLGYFLLTNLLMPALERSKPARIVSVASDAHRAAHLDFEDLQGRKKFSGWAAYSRSKLANIMFTYELARRTHGSGVTANCLHPGVVRTELFRDLPAIGRVLVKLAAPFFRTPQKGAETTIYLASSSEIDGVSGKYFKDCRETQSSKESYDSAAAGRLWDISEQLTAVPSRARTA